MKIMWLTLTIIDSSVPPLARIHVSDVTMSMWLCDKCDEEKQFQNLNLDNITRKRDLGPGYRTGRTLTGPISGNETKVFGVSDPRYD